MSPRRTIPLVLILALLATATSFAGAAAAAGYRRPHVELSVDTSGRVVAAIGGGGANRYGVVRLDAAGQLDGSFAGDGILGPRPGRNPVALALRPSGKILLGDQAGHGAHAMLRRFFVDGRPDRSFGRGGATRLPADPAGRMLVEPDGHILVLVMWTCPSSSCGYTFTYLEIRRYGSNGRLVSRTTHYNELWGLEAAALEADGRLVVAGSDHDLGYHSFARIRRNGKLDPSIPGEEGLKVYESRYGEVEPGDEELPDVTALAVQPDGKFVLASDGYVTELRRRNRNGTVDTGFGTAGAALCAGLAQSPLPPSQPFVALDAAADGTILAAGGGGSCGLVKYLPDGSLDPAFGSGGRVDVEALGLPRPRTLAVGPGGELVVSGWDEATHTVKIARFSAEGRLDPGFGVAGVATLAGF